MLEYLTKVRRSLHKIPELANCEFKTQKFVESELQQFDIPYFCVDTGVIATLDVGKDHTIAFRSDMDALPIQEENECDFVSQHPGKMHACGHDGHMAMLLGFAKWCSQNKDKLKHNVRFVFQPAEEGGGGAEKMIKGGALKDVDQIYAFHVAPNLKGGLISTKEGGLMAGAYEFNLTFFGKNAHAAEKEKGIDALLCACKFVDGAKDCIQKGDNVLFHVGKMEGGTCANVVASKATCSCTLRYFSLPQKEKTMRAIDFLLKFVCAETGATAKIDVFADYIPVVNNKSCIDKIAKYQNFEPAKPQYMAEDFAFYLQKTKGALFFLGIQNEGENKKLHTPTLNFDEKYLQNGVELYKKIICNI